MVNKGVNNNAMTKILKITMDVPQHAKINLVMLGVIAMVIIRLIKMIHVMQNAETNS
jgi:hypothetical protein